VSKNQTIETLRGHLFATLESLQDKQNPMDIDRAKAITDVAQVIINSAKAEIEHIRVTGGNGSGFITEAQADPSLPTGTTRVAPGVTVHRIRG
jgi:hypothetical protein